MTQPTPQTPEWMSKLQTLYGSGIAHAFILHFNIKDMALPGVAFKAYLAKALAQKEVVVFYDVANGFSFPLETMRQRFVEVLGLNEAARTGPPSLIRSQANAPVALPDNPSGALPLIEKLLRAKSDNGGFAVIINNAEALLPNADLPTIMMTPETRETMIRLTSWGSDMGIAHTGNMVLMTTEMLGDLHPSLRAASSKYEAIAVDLPDYEQRLAYIRSALANQEHSIPWSISPEAAAAATAGMTLLGVEDVLLRGQFEQAMTRDLIVERKQTITAAEFAEVIEIVDPTIGWGDIGGLDHIKRFFDRRIVQAIGNGRHHRVPMGVLMVGPPGTGKSVMAQAVAGESGINFVSLNLAKIFDKYVGNSERNLERALQAIKSLEPCIVFIDEIDQSVSRSSGGDSGVSARIFKRLLEFMSDTSHRGQIIFLAATNRPDLIDPALMRPGRIDVILPFFAPDEAERSAIIRVMAAKYGLLLGDVPAAAVDSTQGWTGAELEAAVIKAVNIVEDGEVGEAEAALVDATRRLFPSTKDIHYYELLALESMNDVDMVPERMRVYLMDKEAVSEELEAHQMRRKPRDW
jgi:transitional endoplasmic reticulum ATPase